MPPPSYLPGLKLAQPWTMLPSCGLQAQPVVVPKSSAKMHSFIAVLLLPVARGHQRELHQVLRHQLAISDPVQQLVCFLGCHALPIMLFKRELMSAYCVVSTSSKI
jgi:hypothetical protein